MKPQAILMEFDVFLTSLGLSFEGIIIGGAALSLLGVITRETRDCDVLDPQIPEDILKASRSFAEKKSREGIRLREDWLNNGPDELKRHLPNGWQFRLQKIFSGKSIELHTLERKDLLATKLFAYCDRGFDLQDCIALNPSEKELKEALDWVSFQDANTDWPEHVKNMFEKLSRRLGHDI